MAWYFIRFFNTRQNYGATIGKADVQPAQHGMFRILDATYDATHTDNLLTRR